MQTNYFTSTAEIKVSADSIVFYTIDGSTSYDANDAKYGGILATIMRQLMCGPTTADFLAAQHVFVEEGEMFAWLDLFARNREGVFEVDGKPGLFETHQPAEISADEIAECTAEDFYDC